MAGDLRFITPDDVETQVFDWGSIKWMSEIRVTGADRFASGVVILEPGKGHARHNHPGSDEVLYFISGEGDQMVEDAAGNPVTRHLRAGDMAFIPDSIVPLHDQHDVGAAPDPGHLHAGWSRGLPPQPPRLHDRPGGRDPDQVAFARLALRATSYAGSPPVVRSRLNAATASRTPASTGPRSALEPVA